MKNEIKLEKFCGGLDRTELKYRITVFEDGKKRRKPYKTFHKNVGESDAELEKRAIEAFDQYGKNVKTKQSLPPAEVTKTISD